MKIYRISGIAWEYDRLYDNLREALRAVNRSAPGRAKKELKEAIKRLERIRPHVKRERLKTLWDLRKVKRRMT